MFATHAAVNRLENGHVQIYKYGKVFNLLSEYGNLYVI